MASASGTIVVDNAVEIRVLNITKRKWWFKRKVLIETRIGNDPPESTWLEIGDTIRTNLNIDLEDI